MKKLIFVLILMVCMFTGCWELKSTQFIENDITIDGHAQTVTLYATHNVSLLQCSGYHFPLKYVYSAHEEIIDERSFYVMDGDWFKVMQPYDDMRTLYVEFAENDTSGLKITDNRMMDSIKLGRHLLIECFSGSNYTSVSARITQLPLSNEQ